MEPGRRLREGKSRKVKGKMESGTSVGANALLNDGVRVLPSAFFLLPCLWHWLNWRRGVIMERIHQEREGAMR